MNPRQRLDPQRQTNITQRHGRFVNRLGDEIGYIDLAETQRDLEPDSGEEDENASGSDNKQTGHAQPH